MNQRTKHHQSILDLINPPGSLRALVVEGADDVRFVEWQLEYRFPGWRKSWVVGPAEGKNRVLDMVRLEPTWFGLVDSDEWDTATLAQLRANNPRVHVLPRYCMESYFVVPQELWGLLPAGQQAAVAGGINRFEADLLAPLDPWVRHGALWRVVNPLWSGLKTRGFKDDLLQLTAAQNDAAIQNKLQEWHSYLDAAALFAAFQDELKKARALNLDEQLKHIVHGKSFFTEHVCPSLNVFFKQRSAPDWLKEHMKSTPSIRDLDTLWTAMGL